MARAVRFDHYGDGDVLYVADVAVPQPADDEVVVQVRAAADGLILQQLLYADEVRSLSELEIDKADVKPAELTLAMQLIEQSATDEYDPKAYVDEVKKRIEAAE